MMPPNMQQQNGSPMYSPYPMPQQQGGFRPTPHARAASIAAPQETKASPASPGAQAESTRRSSMPTPNIKTESPQQSHTPQPRSSVPTGGFSQAPKQGPNQPYLPQYNMGAFGNEFSPFSTALPAESQMLLGSALDPADPLTFMFMSGNEGLGQSSYGFNGSVSQPHMDKVGSQSMYPGYHGLNSTLTDGVALSALDLTGSKGQSDFNFTPNFFDAGVKHTSGAASTVGTPGLSGDKWDQWIDSDQWADMATASQ